MRENLKDYYGKKIQVQATVDGYGQKTNYKGYLQRTILLINVYDATKGVKDTKTGVIDPETAEILTDHLWFTVGKRFEKLALISGDIIEFFAHVTSYMKGYERDEFDYKLSHPSKLELIQRTYSIKDLHELYKDELSEYSAPEQDPEPHTTTPDPILNTTLIKQIRPHQEALKKQTNIERWL